MTEKRCFDCKYCYPPNNYCYYKGHRLVDGCTLFERRQGRYD